MEKEDSGRSPSGRATHEPSQSSLSRPSVSVPSAAIEAVSRRSFLGGFLTLGAVALLPKTLNAPTIYADGVHDDTDGLQALFDGKPFHLASDGVTAQSGDGFVRLIGGEYTTSRTIVIKRNNVEMSHFKITSSAPRHIFSMTGSDCSISHCHFVHRRSWFDTEPQQTLRFWNPDAFT